LRLFFVCYVCIPNKTGGKMVKKATMLSVWFTRDEAPFLLHASSSHSTRKEESNSSALVVSALPEALYTAHSASSSAEI